MKRLFYIFALILAFGWGGAARPPFSYGEMAQSEVDPAPVFNVKTFGAKGDGVKDDTFSIQAAINAARQVKGTVMFPPATYRVTSLSVYAGVTLEGYGATLKRPANQPNWTRTLTTPTADLYSGTTDSAPLVIRGLTVDGNRANQGVYTGYELEQAQLIALAGSNTTPGRLRVILQDLTLTESASDGILLTNNVDATVRNIRARNCFRGGLVIGGGHSIIRISNYRATGTTNARGFDAEVDTAGYKGSLAVRLQMTDAQIEKYFDLGVLDGSTVTLSNVRVDRGPVTFATPNSTVDVLGGSFPMGLRNGSTSRIVTPKNVTFQGTRFVLTESAESGESNRELGFDVYFGREKEQTLRFMNCVWEIAADVEVADTLYAVYIQPVDTSKKNRVVLVNPSIESRNTVTDTGRRVDYGIYLKQGGILEVQGGRIVARTPIWLSQGLAPLNVDLTIDGLDVTGSGKWMHVNTHDASSIIRIKNVVVEESDAQISTTYGLKGNTFISGRTILVERNPTGRLSGLVGDRARLISDSGGGASEWICTESGIGSSATWIPAISPEF